MTTVAADSPRIPAMLPGIFEPRPRKALVEPRLPLGPYAHNLQPADSKPHGQHASVPDSLQRAVVRLIERFIRLMK